MFDKISIHLNRKFGRLIRMNYSLCSHFGFGYRGFGFGPSGNEVLGSAFSERSSSFSSEIGAFGVFGLAPSKSRQINSHTEISSTLFNLHAWCIGGSKRCKNGHARHVGNNI